MCELSFVCVFELCVFELCVSKSRCSKRRESCGPQVVTFAVLSKRVLKSSRGYGSRKTIFNDVQF